jgi:amidohydrolase
VTGPRADASLAGLGAALTAGVAAELAAAIELRHGLHAEPDLSGSEERTARRVAAALGDPAAPRVAGPGRLIRIGPPDGPCVGVRAELDALPVTEQTGVPWAAPAGAMHACGHDVHLAALTALGRAARSVELPAALLAVLQPREEVSPSGARDVVASAELPGQRLRAMVGVHLQHALPADTVAATPGTVNAATDDFEVIVTGKAGHAGYPHLAVNPVPALCAVVLALQQIASRVIDPTHAVVASVGAIEGGRAANVIPETARARGSLRCLDEDDRPRLRQGLQEIAEHASRGYGCAAEVIIHDGEPPLVNDPALAAASWPWLARAGFTVADDFRSCGADDFSYYAEVAPALMLFVGTPDSITLHHPRFLPPDEAVGQVAAAMIAGYLAGLSI